ncbi:MAG TPA: energy transducer TonB, partial [Candidatus Methylacidiphilales bacterium]
AAEAAESPPQKVAETPPPPPELPPLPDIPPAEPPPPALAEMPIPSVPIPPGQPLPVPPRVVPTPAPPSVQAAPAVKKVVKAPRVTPPAPAAPQEIAQADPTDYLDAPRPDYPYNARRNHQQGTVELLVTLDSGGRPGNVSIYRSSGWAILDESARAQVLQRWLFKPGNSSSVLVPIEFTMAH